MATNYSFFLLLCLLIALASVLCTRSSTAGAAATTDRADHDDPLAAVADVLDEEEEDRRGGNSRGRRSTEHEADSSATVAAAAVDERKKKSRRDRLLRQRNRRRLLLRGGTRTQQQHPRGEEEAIELLGEIPPSAYESQGGSLADDHHRRVDAIFKGNGDDDVVRAIVGYKSDVGRIRIDQARYFLSSLRHADVDDDDSFPKIHAVAVNVTKALLRLLESDPDISYIEKDERVYMLQEEEGEEEEGETVPWGIEDALAGGMIPQPPSGIGLGDCDSENAFKVAIVDSGTSKHPDLKCAHDSTAWMGCRGRSFGTSAKWYEDTVVGHGTKVLGVINALGDNGSGIRGMVGDRKLCLLIARVFGDEGETSVSSVMQAARWAADQGASIINLSLGTTFSSRAAREFFKDLTYNQGRIVVAAAGNDGTSKYIYPAAYEGVVGVGAIDSEGRRAKFSNYNRYVDFAAPGFAIESTAPGGKYSKSSGTSMAAPHMTGAIALAWRNCRNQCTNMSVLRCFRETAVKKGDIVDGKSLEYGNGIVQTRAAYLCLKNSCCA